MPTGFRGEDTKEYLQTVSDALERARTIHNNNPFVRLSSHVLTPPVMPRVQNRKPTHPPETASSGAFQKGTGSSRNIVAWDGMPYPIALRIEKKTEDIGFGLYNKINQLLALCQAHYQIPQTTMRVIRLLCVIQQSLNQFREPTDTMILSLQGFSNDLGDYMVWNLDDAEDVRIDCVRDMELQVDFMQDSERTYQNMKIELLRLAQEEDRIALTATMQVRRVSDTDGSFIGWVLVADHVTRRLAADRTVAYRNQAAAAEQQANSIRNAITELNFAINTSNALFSRFEATVANSDCDHAGCQRSAGDLANAYRAWMSSIRDSFSVYIPPSNNPRQLEFVLHNFNPRSGNLDLKMLLSAENIDWVALREYSWSELENVICLVYGVDVWEQLQANVSTAEQFLSTWGFPVEQRSTDLLLEKLNDHIIMEKIRTIASRDHFSIEAWVRADTLEARQALMQKYMDALIPVFGVSIEPLICFSEPNDRVAYGSFTYSEHGGTVWINPTYIDPNGTPTAEQSFLRLGTIAHELRHAYQASAIVSQEIVSPEVFMVSRATLRAWHNNFSGLGGTYIAAPPPLPINASEEERRMHRQWELYYRNQPREVDAFGFNDIDRPGWRKEE
ncbi:MAG: hypothetical protein LBC73_06960 [Oscillospiraceae bacterium]|jgi:hypothetical protein|nr:hypothetical protein [Oscillospiraceae bacterium]